MRAPQLRSFGVAFVLASQLALALGTATPALASIATTMSIVGSPDPAWSGDTVTITATVSPNPGGGQISIGGQLRDVDPATGSVSSTFVFHRAGLLPVQGTFTGFGDYAPTGLVTGYVQVNDHPVSLSIDAPTTVGRGDGFNVSVPITGSPPAGSGYVQVRDMALGGLGTFLGNAAITGTSPLTVAIPGLLPGTYQLQASYPGTTDYTSALSTTDTVTVTDRPTTTTISLSPNPADWGAPVTVNVQVSPVPDNGGGVRISLDGHGLGFATMNWNNGKGTFTLDDPGTPGTHTVLAEFLSSGSPVARYADSSQSKTLTVNGTPIDTDPPVGTVLVNGGASLVQEGYVELTMTATDASQIVEMDVSNDNATWAVYGNESAIGWSVQDPEVGGSSIEGTRTVYVRWKDTYGNVGTASDSFNLDFVGPTGNVAIDASAAYTLDTGVTVSVSATDAGSGVAKVALSNDGVTWTERNYGSSQAWTLAGGNGTKTVHVKWRDGNGHWSSEKTDTILLDAAAPTGSVSIQGGATFTRSTSVTVAVGATDAGSGMSQVALSNDGVTFTTRAYAASQAWTLASTNGARTVYVKWKDLAGNWSAVSTDAITLDTVAPTATAPTYRFVSGVAMSSTATPTKFAWTGTDATSGVARYEAALSTDGGAYASISTSLTSASLTRNLASGHTYRLRLRAVDKAGLFGAWVYGATFTVSAYQETSTRITYTGTWSRPASSSYWSGYEKYATAAGAKASFTFTGRAYALIGCVGPSRGSVKVYVNGVLTTTVSTYAATTSCRRVLLALSWSTAISRKVSIVVSGTSGHPRVDLDAIIAAY